MLFYTFCNLRYRDFVVYPTSYRCCGRGGIRIQNLWLPVPCTTSHWRDALSFLLSERVNENVGWLKMKLSVKTLLAIFCFQSEWNGHYGQIAPICKNDCWPAELGWNKRLLLLYSSFPKEKSKLDIFNKMLFKIFVYMLKTEHKKAKVFITRKTDSNILFQLKKRKKTHSQRTQVLNLCVLKAICKITMFLGQSIEIFQNLKWHNLVLQIGQQQ